MSTPTPLSPNGRFSRVFSESDEIRILKYLIRAVKYVPRPITTVGTQTIELIVSRLDHKFSISQINDKLRRLRDKYHKYAGNKNLVRTHHDRRLFKLSKRIWGERTVPKKKKKKKNSGEVRVNHETGSENLERFPYLVSEFSKVLPENEVWKEKIKGLGEEKLRKMDQEWIFLKVEEAKLVAKKAELIQQQIMEVIGGNGSVSNSVLGLNNGAEF